MNGIVKLIFVAVLALGGFALWKYLFSPATEISSEKPAFTVTQEDHVKGHADAPVTVIEYTDFQCPACGAYYPVLNQLLKDAEGKFKLVVRHYPLMQLHPNALAAARASEAAARQGKFFEMYDQLFSKQSEWSSAADPTKSVFPSYAGAIGLNVEQFRKDMADPSIDDKINKDRESGNSLNIQGTPTFFVNGEKIANPNSEESFRSIIEAAALKAPAKKKDESTSEEVHEHVDFAVYLNGKKVDFTQAKYQSDKQGKELDEWTHLHDGNGSIIHKHKAGMTIGHFFKSLGIDFTKECFQLDGGEGLCNGGDKKLKFYVNGKTDTRFDEYELHDLDRVLISYGNDAEKVLQEEISSVSDQACIYSEKCPERGTPPTENCVGGLGTNCQ